MSTRSIILTAGLILLGAGGGWLAAWVNLPMPYLTGALLVSAATIMVAGQTLPPGYVFPNRFRQFFVGIIGAMIGSQVRPEILGQVPSLAVSFSAVVLFVIAAQLSNYAIFRRIGGYDPATSWFSGSPGGLIEAVTMGEAMGADIRVMTLQQFLRIISVVTVLPFALSLYHGAPVGSAAGISFGSAKSSMLDVAAMVVLVLSGLVIGRLLRLPAWQLTGPLVVAGVLAATGWMPLSPPGWLAQVAQVVLGVSLGTRFLGVSRRLLVKAVGMSLITVSTMLALGAAMALMVNRVTGIGFEVLFISMAPGGVTEMALVALSLNANPAFVTLHHLFRITITVLFLVVGRKTGVVKFEPGGDHSPMRDSRTSSDPTRPE